MTTKEKKELEERLKELSKEPLRANTDLTPEQKKRAKEAGWI